MEKHTPSPWYDDGYRIYAPTEKEDKRDGRVIVEYKHVDYFNKADARLMTASPELLEAAIQVIWKVSHNYHKEKYQGPARITREDATVRMLVDAVKKATGEE